jgi:hypothetical protein
MMKARIPAGSVKRSHLEPRMRNQIGGSSTLTKIYTSGPGAVATGTVLLEYAELTSQQMIVASGEYGFLSIDASTAITANGDVTTGPFLWTSDRDRAVSIDVIAEVVPSQLQAFVLAVRVNDRDVASSHYLMSDNTLRVNVEVVLAEDDVVSIEYRASNPLSCPLVAEVVSATVVVTSI